MVVVSHANGHNGLSANDTAYVRNRSHRIRKAMFPDIEPDLPEEPEPAASSTLSIIEMLSQPLAELKNAVVDLLHVQDDSEAALLALPTLIQHLSDKDPNKVAHAAQMIYMLSKQERFIQQLATDAKLVGALVKALGHPDERVRNAVAATLCKLSTNPEGRLHIFRSGGIAELVRMLRSPIITVKEYAVTTLHNLLLYLESAKQDTIACGGLEAFVPLLQSPNPRMQALVADSLYILLLDRPQCKHSFLSLQGPHLLIHILVTTDYTKLIHAVIRCIRSIAISPENKQCLISLSALEELHRLLPKITDTKRRLALLQAMRNLSDAATNLSTLSHLVIDLLALLGHSDDTEIVSCACGILSNLTCNNVLNKQAVCANQGIRILAHTLQRFSYIEDITEPALCTMRHCTARHALAVDAQDEVRLVGAYPTILSLLATRRPPIVKAALGLVRNCALSDINMQTLISEATIQDDTVAGIAIEILFRSGQILEVQFDAVEDGVMMMEMLEGAVSALHQLSRDPYIARQVYTHDGLMNVFVQLLGNDRITTADDELVMREILGLIYQLTKTPEGAKAVESYGSTPYIVDTLGSRSKPIQAYASIILKNMGVNKPLEYQRRLRTPTAAIGHQFQQHTNQGYTGENGWMEGLEPELFNELYNYASVADLHLNSERIESHAHAQSAHHANNSWYDTDL